MQTWAFAEGFAKNQPARKLVGGGMARASGRGPGPVAPGIGNPTVKMDPTKPYRAARPGVMDMAGAMARRRMGDRSGVQRGIEQKVGISSGSKAPRFGEDTPEFGAANPFTRVGKTGRKKELPDEVLPVVPATTADVYRNSRRKKEKAAVGNLSAKIGGGAAGTLVGLGAFAASKGRITRTRAGRRVLAVPTRVGRLTVTPEHKTGYLASVVTSAGAGAGSYTGASLHRKHVMNDGQYAYKKGRASG